MPIRTIAELCYVIASTVVTYAITRLAMWGYPQGRHTIWLVGLGSMAAVFLLGLKPLWTAWNRDKTAQHDV